VFVKRRSGSTLRSLVAQVSDLARELIENGKLTLKAWGHDKVVASAKRFVYNGDSFSLWAPVKVYFCFRLKVPESSVVLE